MMDDGRDARTHFVTSWIMTFFSKEKKEKKKENNLKKMMIFYSCYSRKRLGLFKCISSLPSIKGESSHALIDSHLLWFTSCSSHFDRNFLWIKRREDLMPDTSFTESSFLRLIEEIELLEKCHDDDGGKQSKVKLLMRDQQTPLWSMQSIERKKRKKNLKNEEIFFWNYKNKMSNRRRITL